MRVGTYIFFGFIFMLFIAGGVHMMWPNEHMINILDKDITLPIAAWVLIPVALLYLMSILHMAYYGSKRYFFIKKWEKDALELEKALFWSVLQEPKKHDFIVPQMKSRASLLNVARVEVVGNIQGISDELHKAIEIVKEIEGGNYIDLNDKKIAKGLSKENPLVIKNNINRLNEDNSFCEDVLQYQSNYDESVISYAMDILAQKESSYKLKKYINLMKKEHLFKLLERAKEGENVALSIELLETFVNQFKLECKDYMTIAKLMHKRFAPDENLKFFQKQSKEHESALNAYLYLLFEYEMLDEVKRILEEYDETELKVFRAFYILKRGKYHFKIDDLLDTQTICK